MTILNTTETETLDATTETVETSVVDSIDAALEKVKKAGRGRPKTVKEPVDPEVAASNAAAKEEAARVKLALRVAKKAERTEKRAAKIAAREEAKAAKLEARAASRAFTVGQAVKVVNGEFAGIQGVVSKCARKRVFIDVVDQKKPLYQFITDVEAL